MCPPGEPSSEVKGMEGAQLPPLSSRELSVLRCLAAGMDTKTIGVLLFISPTTVRNHVQNILRELEVHSRLQAVLLAIHEHWV